MKKGAYDLGRKVLYYVVAAMIIALVFIYISNALYKYQKKGFENLKEIEGVGVLNKINSCFYYEDKEINRVYANTVDMEKFKKENLQQCTDQKMRIMLTRLGKEPKTTTISQGDENVIETQTFRRLVTIRDQGREEEGLLQVVVPQ
ncbi:MAG: hypothetical protein ABIH63_02535 [archaeon]